MYQSSSITAHVAAWPPTMLAFRLTGASDGSPWLSDEMGGAFDPGDPRLTRRDFLVRVAIATGAVTVGGAINALTMAAVHQSDPSTTAGERR
jgi:hypothetical protein